MFYLIAYITVMFVAGILVLYYVHTLKKKEEADLIEEYLEELTFLY